MCVCWGGGGGGGGGVNSFLKSFSGVLIKTNFNEIDYWNRARTITNNESKRQIYVQ